MRKSFNGLSGLVKEHIQIDVFSGHLFIFFNRQRAFVKILMWNDDGLSLWSKQLESGTFEKLVTDQDGSLEIDPAGLMMMLRARCGRQGFGRTAAVRIILTRCLTFGFRLDRRICRPSEPAAMRGTDFD